MAELWAYDTALQCGAPESAIDEVYLIGPCTHSVRPRNQQGQLPKYLKNR